LSSLKGCSKMLSTELSIFIEEAIKYRRYFENPVELGNKVKEIISKYVRNVEVYVFGSVVRGRYTASSDIDILVVTPIKLSKEDIYRLKTEVITSLDAPLELHIVSRDEFENWYKRFIGKDELVKIP